MGADIIYKCPECGSEDFKECEYNIKTKEIREEIKPKMSLKQSNWVAGYTCNDCNELFEEPMTEVIKYYEDY